jgi:ATP-dependent RNA helicase DDX23/PRP28
MNNKDGSDEPPRRRVPLSLEALRKKREAEAAAGAKLVFVPKDARKPELATPAVPLVSNSYLSHHAPHSQLAAAERTSRLSPRTSPALTVALSAARPPAQRKNRRAGNFVSRYAPAAGSVASDDVPRKRLRAPEIIPVDSAAASVLESEERERDAIRKHYMPEERGFGERPRSLPAHFKHGEKSRFRFDWGADEDTDLDAQDSLYSKLRSETLVSSLQFGRGGLGGMHDVQPFPGVTGGAHRGGAPLVSSLRDTRHWSDKKREEMTERDWAIFREDHAISLRGGALAAARPARNWDETGLPREILRLVRDVAGYAKPSPIQMATIPIGLRRRDLIGLAETGSGKTAAFVLPMLVHIRQMPAMTAELASQGPYALVLAPTRELVLQIEAETRKFAAPLGLRVTAVIGGQGLEEQGMVLQAGCEIVICTPGRMVDLLSRRLAALGNCNYLILDEADRMIDMGFEPQVQEILSSMPELDRKRTRKRARVSDGAESRHSGHGLEVCGCEEFDDGESADKTLNGTRQTFMFSATMSPAIERLARDYLSIPMIITIGETGKAAEAVDQRVEFLTSEGQKRDRLVRLIRSLDPPVIVFANTKKGCEDVARLIELGTGMRPVVLHSGKSQDQREESLDGFKAGRFGILVATDVVGRGIDIKGVNHVVNYELPTTIAPYTHRIGRTGRAGRTGIAWSLATAADSDIFSDLKHHLEQAGARVPPAIARHDSGRASGLRPIID